MKVVFLQDVPDVAKAGDVKEVADGYARNYLIPRKMATLASPHAISRVETSDKIAAKTLDELAVLADKLDGKEVSLKAHAGAKDRLYGSITSADIAAELERATGIAVDKRKIELDKPIHQLGDYELTIKLGKDIAPKIKVSVIEEEAPPEEEKPKKAKKAAKKTAKAEEKPKAKKTAAKKTTKKKEETAEKETKAKKTAKKTTKKATEAEKEKKPAKKKETAAKKTTKKTTKKKEETA
ncbi:MAG: 50S ribosomal protein L9 [Dehalococcoidia bacterium]|jgi:large subunit ribosomal protein L9